MDPADRIREELEDLGYAPVLENHGDKYPKVLTMEYEVQIGRFCGEKFYFGISMQGLEGYPDYPPHFIHVSPPIESPQDGKKPHSIYSASDRNGNERQWGAYSRPPKDIWDSLPKRGMKAFMEHVHRFWRNV